MTKQGENEAGHGFEAQAYLLQHGVTPAAAAGDEDGGEGGAGARHLRETDGRESRPPRPRVPPTPIAPPQMKPKPAATIREGDFPPGVSGLPASCQPERALLAGVLNQARLDYCAFYSRLCRARERRARNIGECELNFAEVRRWLHSRQVDGFTCFESICQVLDLTPSVLRAGVVGEAEERERRRRARAAACRARPVRPPGPVRARKR